MTRPSLHQPQQQTSTTHPLSVGGLLQRKCEACGQHTIAGEMCPECEKEESLIQRSTKGVGALPAAPLPPPNSSNSGFNHDISRVPVRRRRPLIQAKLTVGEPGDQYEQEADRIADQVMRMPDPALQTGGQPSAPLAIQRLNQANDENLHRQYQEEQEEEDEEEKKPEVQTKALAGAPVEPLSPALRDRVQRQAMEPPEEEEEKEPADRVQAKGQLGQTPQVTPSLEVRLAASRGQGEPLPEETRSFMESRFRQDFSGVRVHAGSEAAQLNRELQAQAFTYRQDIYFGAGKYNPASTVGKWLLSHELVHTLQQGKNTLSKVSRNLDPANPMAWEWFDRDYRRQQWRGTFEGTLAAAPAASLQIEQELQQGLGVPQDEESRERLGDEFEHRVETLIRLNAIGLMASHKASIELRRNELLNPELIPEEIREQQPTSEEAMQSVREAARVLRRLTEVKEELEGYKSDLHGVAAEAFTGICLSMSSCLENWGQTIYQSTRQYRSSEIQAFFEERSETLQDGIPRDMVRLFVRNMADYLDSWRGRQIDGIQAATSNLYENFPLFKTLDAEDVVEDPDLATNEALLQAVRRAYDELLNDVDEAIVQIGSGDIHPFDLPEAVNVTKSNLPSNVRDEIDRLLREHQTREFWKTLGLTLAEAIAVFIPVIGPAIALGIGIVSTAIDLESLLDRVELAEAATSPEGEILGTHGPSAFDYVMAGIQVILTAFDVGALATEIRGARTAAAHATAEPHAVREALEEGTETTAERSLREGVEEGTGRASRVGRGRIPELPRCRTGSLFCPIDFLQEEFSDLFQRRSTSEFAPYVRELSDDLNFGRSLRREQTILTGNDMYAQYLREVSPNQWSEPFRRAYDEALAGQNYREIIVGGQRYRWPLDDVGAPWVVHHDPPLGWVHAESNQLWHPTPYRIHDAAHQWWGALQRRIRSRVPPEMRREIFEGDFDIRDL